MGTKYEVKNTGEVDFKQKGTTNLVMKQGTVPAALGAFNCNSIIPNSHKRQKMYNQNLQIG